MQLTSNSVRVQCPHDRMLPRRSTTSLASSIPLYAHHLSASFLRYAPLHGYYTARPDQRRARRGGGVRYPPPVVPSCPIRQVLKVAYVRLTCLIRQLLGQRLPN